ncbi:MAG TPA: hypothetical protein VNI83_02125 [Vicinamibacterales bacterium]|nr:hypothetical protein [Vicinamibacterales bacterium]
MTLEELKQALALADASNNERFRLRLKVDALAAFVISHFGQAAASDYEGMTKGDLLDLAAQRGLSFSRAASRAQIIEGLLARGGRKT